MSLESRDAKACDASSGCCGGVNRREVLKFIGIGAGAMAMSGGWTAMAGPFTREDFDQMVPADKKLKPEWLQSLVERGTREIYRGGELEKIGMPIGGLCAGQMYLGGDGKLWCWDIFNGHARTGAEHYAKPLKSTSGVEQGFALRVSSGETKQVRTLDTAGFSQVEFCGEYPIGYVKYSDPKSPVTVGLEAFSPFVPLETEESSLPATVLELTVKNTGSAAVEVELAGWLENAVCGGMAAGARPGRVNAVAREGELVFLDYSVVAGAKRAEEKAVRADVVFEDFQKPTYEGWTTTGTAFGDGPVEIAKMPKYQGKVGAPGKYVVNSHNARKGEGVGAGDGQTGTLTSKTFKIERNFINFLVGGGNHAGKTCVNLLMGGKVVLSQTGHDDNKMRGAYFDVRPFQGSEAQIQVVDEEKGAWGNISVARIVFSDRPGGEGPGAMEERGDFGTMGLGLIRPVATDRAVAYLPEGFKAEDVFSAEGAQGAAGKSVGAIVRTMKLEAGQEATATFVVTWRFANLAMKPLNDTGRYYAKRFGSARAVAQHVAKEFDSLKGQTRLWHDTWYDSTLPYWFLNRTFLNTSILATSTSYRFESGRFYGWEGVGCCPGTCTHVWHYAHAPGRVFPELERILRERVDFGLALQADGAIRFRGEANGGPAVDGQAGSILRAYREHQMSADDAFLKRNWEAIKKATQWLINKDGDGDGIIVSNQHNTLDADWFGPVAWLSGLYLAALRAGETMALEMGDGAFAGQCRGIFEKGRKNIVERLFDGDYFINKPDPKHPDAINSGTGCEIDQVFGQSWAWQVGLGRVLPEKETRTALKSLWRYNFSPDVGPYREKNKPGRWYAMAGEAGLLMCSFPRKDWDYGKAAGKGPGWAAGYFNECMNGFEYQAAGHMIWEGMVQEGLAVTRAVHDRYHPSRRNPYNEIECGDHYARSMASYGVYLAACGFECHGPKGHVGFAPRLTPEDFKAAFTMAQGWGTFSQKKDGNGLNAAIEVKWGTMVVKTIALAAKGEKVSVKVNGAEVAATVAAEGERVVVTLAAEAKMGAGGKIEVRVG